MKKTKIIAVHNIKGGVGKTAITTILASTLSYVNRRRVLVFDVDDGQHSISKHRESELTMLKRIETVANSGDIDSISLLNQQSAFRSGILRFEFNKRESITTKDYYPIVDTSEEQLVAKQFIDGEYDFIFIDMGGRVNENITRILARCDLIVVPFGTQSLELKTSSDYLRLLRNSFLSGQLPASIQIVSFWNRYQEMYKFAAAEVERTITPQVMGAFYKGFLETRLGLAQSGFDKNIMLTTISSPMVIKGGEYQQAFPVFCQELLTHLEN